MFRGIASRSARRSSVITIAATLGCRRFSLVSVHSRFPATLYRFQLWHRSSLHDQTQAPEDSEYEDGVQVAKNGLVYPGFTESVSNGALFMPNTFCMQELSRMAHDYYVDNMAEREPSADPHYLSLAKGTSIPSSLILFRERDSRFTLQPAYPMSLNDLNNRLTEFYSQSGSATSAGKWLEGHDYARCYVDDKEEWMDE